MVVTICEALHVRDRHVSCMEAADGVTPKMTAFANLDPIPNPDPNPAVVCTWTALDRTAWVTGQD